jgi:hypothetical protein
MHNTTIRRVRRFGLITATAAGMAGATLAMSASANADDNTRRQVATGITASGGFAEGKKKVELPKPAEQLTDVAVGKPKPKMGFGDPAEVLPDPAQGSIAEKLANKPDDSRP